MADGSLHGQVVFLTNKHNGLVLDAGPNWNICQWKRNNQPHQKFKLDHAGGGKYHIICEKDGKALDVEGGSNKNGTGIIKFDFHGSDNQKWIFEACKGGWVIMTALGKRVIDVPGGSYEQGCNLVIWDKHRGDNQVFFAGV